MTKHNDPLPKDTKDLKDKDEGKGVAIGEPHPPKAPKDEPDCEPKVVPEAVKPLPPTAPKPVEAEVEPVAVEPVGVPFEPETRTIAEQTAALQAIQFGVPVEVEEDSDGEE